MSAHRTPADLPGRQVTEVDFYPYGGFEFAPAAPTIDISPGINNYPSLAPAGLKQAWETVAQRGSYLLPWWSQSDWKELSVFFALDEGREGGATSKWGEGQLAVWVVRRPSSLQGLELRDMVQQILQEAIRVASRRTKIPAMAVPDEMLEGI